MITWSYSSLGLFKQCPRKYYRLRVAKDVKEENKEHLIYGNEVHKAAENYGKSRKPIPKKFQFIQPYLDMLLTIKGEFFFEHRLGLTKDRNACEFFAPDVWWRGVADFLCVREGGKEAVIVDYKTGKSAKYADTDQLEILALATFSHFPEVDIIDAGLLFVVSKEFVEVTIKRERADIFWKKWEGPTSRLEQAYESQVWNASPNFTCRKFCPVMDCEHNGRR